LAEGYSPLVISFVLAERPRRKHRFMKLLPASSLAAWIVAAAIIPASAFSLAAQDLRRPKLIVTDTAGNTVTLQPGPGRNDGSDVGSAGAGKDTGVFGQPGNPDYPNINFSKESVVYVQSSTCNTSSGYAYLQFSLAGLPAQNIASAKVQVYLSSAVVANLSPLPVNPVFALRRVTSTWDETTMTWNRGQPTFEAATLDSQTMTGVAGNRSTVSAWLTFDITALYRAWAGGSTPNYGLRLSHENGQCLNGWICTLYTSNDTPPGAPCTLSLSATGASGTANGGTGAFNVNASGTGCSWTARANVTWIHLTSGTSGTASGKVAFSVDANTAAARSGTITVSGGAQSLTFTVNQAAAPTGAPAVSVFADPGSVTTSLFYYPNLASITGSPVYNGNFDIRDAFGGTFTTSGGENGHSIFTDTVPASGYYTLQFQTKTPVQLGSYTLYLADDGAPAPTYRSATHVTFLAGSSAGSLSVIADTDLAPLGSSYGRLLGATPVPGLFPIQVTGTLSGSPTYQFFELRLTPNNGTYRGVRILELVGTGAGASATCAYSINPVTGTSPAGGGTASVSVAAVSGCSWTATSNASWITIASGASGSGTVNYSVQANTTTASRTGTLTIAGQTFTVTQAAGGSLPLLPAIAQGGVVNSADFTAAVAPGGLVTITGINLSSTTQQAQGASLPEQLDGVSVEVLEGAAMQRAPLLSIGPRQISAQLPFSLTGPDVQVRVRNAAGLSSSAMVRLARRAPRLFTRTLDGKGEASIRRAADAAFISRDNPALAGEDLQIFLTGLGEVSPAALPGRPGGDDATNGPKNQVTDSVTVTIGEKVALVNFAGLAPGQIGMYQVDITAPMDLEAGQYPVLVSVRSDASQGGVIVVFGPRPATPEEVVKAALEAQARGDITGMLALCSMDEVPEPNARKAREILEAMSRAATVTDFQFEHLATGLGDEGTLAMVRAKVYYTVATRAGQFPMVHGLLGYTQKENGVWKLVTLMPDLFLNQEIYEASLPEDSKEAARFATLQAADLNKLNKVFTEIIKNGRFDQKQMKMDVFFAGVGRIPVVGDAIADCYQAYNVLKDANGVAKEVVNSGFNGLAVLKMEKVAAGIFQIISEPIPGLDTVADTMALHLEQIDYNLELARSLAELRRLSRGWLKGKMPLETRLAPVTRFPYPAGTQFDADVPIRMVHFTKAASFDQPVAFRVFAELPIEADSPAADLLAKLGGEVSAGQYHLPIEAGMMVDGGGSAGDQILEGYNKFRTKDNTARIVRWVATCRRGKQELNVHLRDGSTSLPFLVFNDIVNDVEALQVSGYSRGNIELKAGSRLDGFSIYGTGAQIAPQDSPDLTNRTECLDMSIADPKIAGLQRSSTVTLRGLAEGQTLWKLFMRGATNSPYPSDLAKDIVVKVGPGDAPIVRIIAELRGYGSYICKSTDPKDTRIHYCASEALGDSGKANLMTDGITGLGNGNLPITWEGTQFKFKGTYERTDPYGGQLYDVTGSGTFDEIFDVLLTATFKLTHKSKTWPADLWGESEWTVTNVPSVRHTGSETYYEALDAKGSIAVKTMHFHGYGLDIVFDHMNWEDDTSFVLVTER
jgi:uncharacterized protein (TIGR03437 family)